MKLNRRSRCLLLAVLAVFLLWGAVHALVRSVENWRWLHAGPIENHPVRIYDVRFSKEFTDLNDVQLSVAQAIGIPPVSDREAAEKAALKDSRLPSFTVKPPAAAWPPKRSRCSEQAASAAWTSWRCRAANRPCRENC